MNPDVVLMDISLSGNDDLEGIDAAKEIRLTTNAKIIFLSSHKSNEISENAEIKAFASGYICKEEHETYTEVIYNAITTTPHENSIKNAVKNILTPAQKYILEGIIDGSVTDDNVDKRSPQTSAGTIKTHRRAIFERLGLKRSEEIRKIFNNW